VLDQTVWAYVGSQTNWERYGYGPLGLGLLTIKTRSSQHVYLAFPGHLKSSELIWLDRVHIGLYDFLNFITLQHAWHAERDIVDYFCLSVCQSLRHIVMSYLVISSNFSTV